MIVALLVLLTCDSVTLGLVRKAAARAEAFDLRGALELVTNARQCDEAGGAAEYLEGLLGAGEAVNAGGTIDSLREVRSATNALSRRAEGGARRWEVAALALRAVAAASQYERAEMTLYLDEATRLEALLHEASLPGAPFVTAHELAGDLWLQIYDFEEARNAYRRAAAVVGRTPRVMLGLARSAERLKDTEAACAEYQSLLEWWRRGPGGATPKEISEAEAGIQSACRLQR